jgi:transposase InsO family protein
MSAHQAEFPVRVMARVRGVSVSGYYAWRSRPASAHATSDAALLRRIRTIHAASHGTYGAPRVHAELQAEGTAVARKRVARLMRMAGLRGVSRRRFPATTQREPSHRPAIGRRSDEARGTQAGRSVAFVGRPAPRHEFVDAAVGPAVDEAGQHVGEVALRVDAVQLDAVDGLRSW